MINVGTFFGNKSKYYYQADIMFKQSRVYVLNIMKSIGTRYINCVTQFIIIYTFGGGKRGVIERMVGGGGWFAGECRFARVRICSICNCVCASVSSARMCNRLYVWVEATDITQSLRNCIGEIILVLGGSYSYQLSHYRSFT